MSVSDPSTQDNITEPDEPDEFFVQAVMLAEVVKRVLDMKAQIFLSRVSELRLRPITEFQRRMRVTGYDKFENTTYISSINFYRDDDSLEQEKALGALILYFDLEFIPALLKKLEYPELDEDDQASIEDAAGTLCNLIAANFKTGLVQLGYTELIMSHFSSYRSEVLNGIPYDPSQKEKYEISFEISGQKRLVADLTMGPIPKEYG